MSIFTLATVRHLSKHAHGHVPASRHDERRCGGWVLTVIATIAVGLLAVALVFGIMFAEQAGIVWLSVLLQAMLFMIPLSFGVILAAICFLALTGIV